MMKLFNTEVIENIANAIREKTGKTNKLKLDEMASEIESIESGGSYEFGTFTGENNYKQEITVKGMKNNLIIYAHKTSTTMLQGLVSLEDLEAQNSFFTYINSTNRAYSSEYSKTRQLVVYEENKIKISLDYRFNNSTIYAYITF